MRSCASHWAPAPPSRPGEACPSYPWLGDSWAFYGLYSGSARGRQQRSSSGQEHGRGWPGVLQVLPPPGTLELGSAPALVALQGQAPGDERVTKPGTTMAVLLPPARSAHNVPWNSAPAPIHHQSTNVGLSPHPARHPTAHPITLLTAQHCPAPVSIHTACPPPLPCPQLSAP